MPTGLKIPTAPHAIPFLVELLDEGFPGRPLALELLELFYSGVGWHQAHQHMTLLDERRSTPEFGEMLAQEQDWVRAIRRGVLAHLEIYLGLLSAADKETRLRAASLLGTLGQAVGLEALARRLPAEPDPEVRACFAVALRQSRAEPLRMLDLLQAEKAALPRLILALGVLAPVGEATPELPSDTPERERAIGEVWEALRTAGCRAEYQQLPNITDFYSDLALALLATAPQLRWEILEVLLQASEGQKYYAPERWSAILLLASGGKPYHGQALTCLQKRAVAAIARLAWPAPKTTFANAATTLRSFGLPDSREKMADFLGYDFLPEPPARERPWWRFWG